MDFHKSPPHPTPPPTHTHTHTPPPPSDALFLTQVKELVAEVLGVEDRSLPGSAGGDGGAADGGEGKRSNGDGEGGDASPRRKSSEHRSLMNRGRAEVRWPCVVLPT